MPTINSIVQKNNLLADVSHRYFKLNTEAADKSVLVGAAIRTNADFLKSDFSGQPALTTMIENYTAEKDDFNSTIKDKLISLQESSDKLKDSVQEDSEKVSSTSTEEKTASEEDNGSALSTLKNFAKDNVPPRAKILAFPQRNARNDNDKSEEIEKQIEKLREEKAEALKNSKRDSFSDFAEKYLEADDDKKGMLPEIEITEGEKISAVKSFVRDYNSALSYLNENRNMSNKISALASTFNDTEELSVALKEIGITISSSGKLSINEEILQNAIERNPNAVTSLLGDGGLAGQLDRALSLANYQGENLFPTLDEYAGEDEFESWEYLYFARTMNTADYSQDRAKNLLNTFT